MKVHRMVSLLLLRATRDMKTLFAGSRSICLRDSRANDKLQSLPRQEMENGSLASTVVQSVPETLHISLPDLHALTLCLRAGFIKVF